MEQHVNVTEEYLHAEEGMVGLEEDKVDLLHALEEVKELHDKLDWSSVLTRPKTHGRINVPLVVLNET